MDVLHLYYFCGHMSHHYTLTFSNTVFTDGLPAIPERRTVSSKSFPRWDSENVFSRFLIASCWCSSCRWRSALRAATKEPCSCNNDAKFCFGTTGGARWWGSFFFFLWDPLDPFDWLRPAAVLAFAGLFPGEILFVGEL